MKRSDIAALVFISSLSMIFAYFVADAFIGGSLSESTKVNTVAEISDTITPPDPSIFNENAINPTVQVVIGNTQKP